MVEIKIDDSYKKLGKEEKALVNEAMKMVVPALIAHIFKWGVILFGLFLLGKYLKLI